MEGNYFKELYDIDVSNKKKSTSIAKTYVDLETHVIIK